MSYHATGGFTEWLDKYVFTTKGLLQIRSEDKRLEEATAQYKIDEARLAAEAKAKEAAADARMAERRGVLVPPPLTAAQQPHRVTFTERTLGKTGVTVGVAAAVGVTALLGAWMWSKHS
jgi:hypothetical protein